MLKSYSNWKERNSLELTSFLWVGPWVVYERCQLSTCAGNIQWFQCQSSFDKLFYWCQFSWWYALSICLWISNGCKTPGVHTLWMKWDKKMSAKLFSCISSCFFLLGSSVAWELAYCITQKSVRYSANPVRNGEFYKEKAISYQKGIANTLPCLQA